MIWQKFLPITKRICKNFSKNILILQGDVNRPAVNWKQTSKDLQDVLEDATDDISDYDLADTLVRVLK